jgi:single-stranded DNA-binding protein
MNNNRDLFAGNLTAEPEINCPPKGTAVVNASLANNELFTSEGGERQQITI